MVQMIVCNASRSGGPEVLVFQHAERPSPAAHEVLIRVGAVGVNRLDAMQRAGLYPVPHGSNPLLGIECGGEIIAIGEKVTGVKLGDRVAALLSGGGYAEYAVADYRHVVPVPTDWDDVRAASVIETFCTAHETLFELSKLKFGERVLIHAGGSAVGSTAIRMAQLIGAQIITTVGSEEKAEKLRKWNVDYVINYRESDFASIIRELFPDGIDVIEDFVGPAYLSRHIDLLRWKGRIAFVGLLTEGLVDLDVAKVLTKMLKLQGFTLRPHSSEQKAVIVKRFQEIWMPRLNNREIEQKIYATLPFSKAIEAHQILESNSNFGKIILKM